MTWDQQQQPDSDRQGDDLDALLAGAVWPDVDAARVARLHREWDRIVRRRTRQRRWVTAAALVGCLLSAAALYQFRRVVVPATGVRSAPVDQVARAPQRPHSIGQPLLQGAAEHPALTQTEARLTDADRAAVVAARTAAEQVVLLTLDRRMRRRAERASVKDDAAVERAITAVRTRAIIAYTLHATLLAGAQVPLPKMIPLVLPRVLAAAALPDIDQIAGRLRADGRRHEHSLATIIRQADGPRRVVAVGLLARIATQRSLPLLIQLQRDPAASRATTAAIVRLADPWTLYRLARTQPSPATRRQLMAALLERGGPRSVDLFLVLVQDPSSRLDALDALDLVTTPPVDTLLQFFNAPRVSYRRAAAQVLGQLPSPAISEVLVAMVLRREHEREALLALSARHDRLATAFIQRAYNDMALTTLVRAAQVNSKSLSNHAGG